MPTRTEVMKGNGVHFLVKDCLKLTEDKDIVDRYYDILLVAEVLKAEMEEGLRI